LEGGEGGGEFLEVGEICGILEGIFLAEAVRDGEDDEVLGHFVAGLADKFAEFFGSLVARGKKNFAGFVVVGDESLDGFDRAAGEMEIFEVLLDEIGAGAVVIEPCPVGFADFLAREAEGVGVVLVVFADVVVERGQAEGGIGREFAGRFEDEEGVSEHVEGVVADGLGDVFGGGDGGENPFEEVELVEEGDEGEGISVGKSFSALIAQALAGNFADEEIVFFEGAPGLGSEIETREFRGRKFFEIFFGNFWRNFCRDFLKSFLSFLGIFGGFSG
jgi:hypothetical protein